MRGVYKSQGGKQLMSVELQIEPQPDPQHPNDSSDNQQNQQ
jgi:hypothetical protein